MQDRNQITGYGYVRTNSFSSACLKLTPGRQKGHGTPETNILGDVWL